MVSTRVRFRSQRKDRLPIEERCAATLSQIHLNASADGTFYIVARGAIHGTLLVFDSHGCPMPSVSRSQFRAIENRGWIEPRGEVAGRVHWCLSEAGYAALNP